MPKIAVDKNNKLALTKYEVRPSRQAATTPPAGDLMLSQYTNEPQLSRHVPATPNAGHDGRTLLSSKNVH
jgi:hypothetical protein